MQSYKTPKAKLFYKRYVEDFNPYEPKKELLEILESKRVSSSGYIKPALRGKKFSEITIEDASYIGYEAKMGTDDSRLLAKLKYYIELTKDESITKDDIEELLYDKDVGLKTSNEQEPNEKVVNSDGVVKPQIF